MKRFNNLFDSIIMLIFTIFSIAFAIILFVTKNEKYNNSATYIVFSVLVIPYNIALICLLIFSCFESWTITSEYICSKKPFRKKVIIKIEEIISVEEKNISALILGAYKTNALIIKSKDKRINIYLDEKITAKTIKDLLGIKE